MAAWGYEFYLLVLAAMKYPISLIGYAILLTIYPIVE